MGTRMAPSYTNIFMGRLEQRLLKNQSKQPMVWWSFIDDIFLVWTHGETSLQAFVDNLNTSHDTIKFTASWSTKEVAYLDTRVYLDGGKIETDLYVKPTDIHQYLLPSSCHPRHCKESIPYSQALRLKRICSKDETYQTRVRKMKQHFLQRGYNEQILESQFKKVAGLTRDETLHHHEREKETRPVLVTFDPRQPPLGQITKKHHHILNLSDKMRKAVPEPPLIAYRRPKNLRDLLVRAEVIPRERKQPGTRPCGGRGCKTCPMLQTMDSITSHITGNTHKIKTSASCKSTNVVYVIRCQRCDLQYVGETEQALHERINSHRSHVKLSKTDKPGAAHFNFQHEGHDSGTDQKERQLDEKDKGEALDCHPGYHSPQWHEPRPLTPDYHHYITTRDELCSESIKVALSVYVCQYT